MKADAATSSRIWTEYNLSHNMSNAIPSITQEQYEHLPSYEQCIARVAVRYGHLIIVKE